jgi:MerR family transcriptional regulator, light-induced transcriptional regulator
MTAEAGRPLTLQEVADLLGVHYMTVYRYVRLGLLEADKVAGTWQVTPAALAELRDRSAVAPASPVRGRRRAPWAERLEHRLAAGDATGSWSVIEAALAAGAELDEVYLDIVAPALRTIGQRWAEGVLDVGVEHRASVITGRLLGRLGPRFHRRGRSRGTVVLGAPAGEHHALPLALLADVVRGRGWDVSDLGADVPARSFARTAAASQRLRMVGVSISTPESMRAGEETIAALRGALNGVPILAGGHAVVDEALARSIGADGWAPHGRAVAALLDTLAGPPGDRTGDRAGDPFG